MIEHQDTRSCFRLRPRVLALTPLTSALSLFLVLVVAACGSDTTALKLVLTPVADVNSTTEVASAVTTLELVVDAGDGLAGVTVAGPTAGGGTALDWDQDGVLEVSFVTHKALTEALPVLELGLAANAGRDLELTVLGYDGVATHQLADASALGRVTAHGNAGQVREVGMSFNLRASARPPRVIMTLPADGDVNVPVNLTYFTLVFSTRLVAASLVDAVELVGDREGAVPVQLTLTDALFVDQGNVPSKRSVLQVVPGWDGQGDAYTLTVGTAVLSEAGRTLDQLPDVPGAQAFVAHFVAPGGVGGPPSGCTECPVGYGCDSSNTSCLPVATCAAGCGPGFVCDETSTSCVDDCRLFGFCPTPGATCQQDTGLCL